MPDPLKIPPHNKDAEMAVLGSIMVDTGALVRVLDMLRPEDFYHTEHTIIYQTMMDLFEKSAPLDILSEFYLLVCLMDLHCCLHQMSH